MRLVHKTLCGQGEPLQYAVFYCERSEVQLQTLNAALRPILNLDEDRVMIVRVGPAEGRGDECLEFSGRPRESQMKSSSPRAKKAGERLRVWREGAWKAAPLASRPTPRDAGTFPLFPSRLSPALNSKLPPRGFEPLSPD